MKKIFVSLLNFLLIAIMVMPISLAYTGYDEVFLSDAIDGTTRWQSPLAIGKAQHYPVITSKWNEQRTTGTSPHVGIDCSIKDSINVVAVAAGTLKKDSTGSAYNNFSIKTAHSTKNVYCHYEHCIIVGTEKYYNAGDPVATAGEYGSPGQPHLHFAAYNTANMSTRKGYRNETLYRGTAASAWNYGRNCDTFSTVGWQSNTTAQITLVFSGSGNTHTEKPSQAQIYYRVNGTTNWIGPYNLTNSSGYIYTYNFKNVVPSGTTINWVVRYRRSSPAAYMWAPAKFYNPSSNPNGSTLPWGYVTSVVSY